LLEGSKDQGCITDDGNVITSATGIKLSAELMEEILGPKGSGLDAPSGANRETTRLQFPISSRMMRIQKGHFVDIVSVKVRDLSPKGIAIEFGQPIREGEKFVLCLPRIKKEAVWVQCSVVRYQIAAANLFVIGATFDRVLELGKGKSAGTREINPPMSTDQDVDAIRRAILS
jgi:hypothetical protein